MALRDLTRHRIYRAADDDGLFWYQSQQIVPQVRACIDISEMQIDIFAQVGAKAGKDLVEKEGMFEVQSVDN